jgi:hypothetical protein
MPAIKAVAKWFMLPSFVIRALELLVHR